jgi:probable HAF family extracellular repeat protein
MHATLSPSWKKSLLLVFVSVVAFATATPATSGPQCFFQGLGFLPGGNQSSPSGVSANGTVVVGSAIDASFHTQAFRWTAASGMVGLGFLPGRDVSGADGVNADGKVVVGGADDASHQTSSLPLDAVDQNAKRADSSPGCQGRHYGRLRLAARIGECCFS